MCFSEQNKFDIFTVGGESDRWKAGSSPSQNDDRSTDINFNLSQYIIQRKHETRQRRHWRTSNSADAAATNRNWRRADLVDDTPARERNTWELSHRSPDVFPVRLIAGDAWNGEELTAVDSSDEEVWIPRLPKHTTEKDASCRGREGCDVKSSACGDVLRTRTKPAARLCSTRS